MAVLGTTAYLQATLPQLAIGRPLWISMWVRGTTSGAGIARLTGAGTSSTVGFYQGGSLIYFYDRNDSNASGGGPSVATPLNGSSAYTGTWSHFFGQISGALGLAADARTLYLNGVQAATGSGAVSGAQTLNQIQVGCSVSATPWYGAQSLAEVSIGSGVLIAAQIQALAGGANPIRACDRQLIAYYPLRGDRASAGPAAPGLAFSGAGGTLTWVDHPPVEQPPRRRFPPTRAVSVVFGAGSIYAAGGAASVSAGASAAPGAGSVVASGAGPSISAGASVSPGAGSVYVAGGAPAIAAGVSVTFGAGSVSAGGAAPSVSAGASVVPGFGTVYAGGAAPTVSAGASAIVVSPGPGWIVASGSPPVVSAGVSVDLGNGWITAAGSAPVIAATAFTPSPARTITATASSRLVTGAASPRTVTGRYESRLI